MGSWTHLQKCHALIIQILWKYRWLMQERRNSGTLAVELRLSCTNSSIFVVHLYEKIMVIFDRNFADALYEPMLPFC